MKTYPLLLYPAIKNYIWGGTRLMSEFGFKGKDIAAEAWVLSCHSDGPSIVQNGELKGKTLSDALSLWGELGLGKSAAKFPYFPLLIKLIDARDRLSVQVHPNDEYAGRVEKGFGKTEMWYVVDCNPGAELIYGLNRTIDKAEFQRRTLDGTLSEVCNFVPVKKGDVFFIEAGTLHAIGAGILIAEVQQNSNITYRVSDYGRLGVDGKPRQLHIDKAVDVTITSPPTLSYGDAGETESTQGGTCRRLAQCEFFSSCILKVTGAMTVGENDSFSSLLCLEGDCNLITDDGLSLPLNKGSSVFIPAGIKAQLIGDPEKYVEILYSYV